MFLGIEIGGTKLQLGIGPGDGSIISIRRVPVDPKKGGDGIREQITTAIPELLKQAGMEKSHLIAAGVGFDVQRDRALTPIGIGKPAAHAVFL